MYVNTFCSETLLTDLLCRPSADGGLGDLDWQPEWTYHPPDSILSFEWFPNASPSNPPFFAFAVGIKDHPVHLLNGFDHQVSVALSTSLRLRIDFGTHTAPCDLSYHRSSRALHRASLNGIFTAWRQVSLALLLLCSHFVLNISTCDADCIVVSRTPSKLSRSLSLAVQAHESPRHPRAPASLDRKVSLGECKGIDSYSTHLSMRRHHLLACVSARRLRFACRWIFLRHRRAVQHGCRKAISRAADTVYCARRSDEGKYSRALALKLSPDTYLGS